MAQQDPASKIIVLLERGGVQLTRGMKASITRTVQQGLVDMFNAHKHQWECGHSAVPMCRQCYEASVEAMYRFLMTMRMCIGQLDAAFGMRVSPHPPLVGGSMTIASPHPEEGSALDILGKLLTNMKKPAGQVVEEEASEQPLKLDS